MSSANSKIANRTSARRGAAMSRVVSDNFKFNKKEARKEWTGRASLLDANAAIRQVYREIMGAEKSFLCC